MSNPDFKTRVSNAFQAMKALGISETKVKPVLKSLLKLYDKQWDLIEEKNYRALKDAIFEKEELDTTEQAKKNVDNEVEDRMQEVTQATEEPVRHLERLRRKYHDGQTSSLNISNTVVTTPPIVEPKEQPLELPETHRGKQNGSTGIVDSPEAIAVKSQAVANQSLGLKVVDKVRSFQAAEQIKKNVEIEVGDEKQDDAQATEEHVQPIKKLRLNYQGGQSSSLNMSSTVVTKPPIVKPKEEPLELPETHSRKLNGSKEMVDSPKVAEVSLNTLAEVEDVRQEVAQETEEPVQPLKKLPLNYQVGQISSLNINKRACTVVTKTTIVKPTEAQATETPVRSPDKRVKEVNDWLEKHVRSQDPVDSMFEGSIKIISAGMSYRRKAIEELKESVRALTARVEEMKPLQVQLDQALAELARLRGEANHAGEEMARLLIKLAEAKESRAAFGEERYLAGFGNGVEDIIQTTIARKKAALEALRGSDENN